LFNSAVDSTQLELATKYLQAADTYRDQLQPDEQATLDAYLKELAKAKAVVAKGTSAAAAPGAPRAEPAMPSPGARCAHCPRCARCCQSTPAHRGYQATGQMVAP
jgi:hypothetical protein